MRLPPDKPGIYTKKGDDLSIPDEDLRALMREVLEKGAFFQFRARGLSMSPFIKNGDVITIAPLAKNKPALGKVVAFLHPVSGRLVVHRVVGAQGADYLIQGDNVAGQTDGLIYPGDILGCVIRVLRDGRPVYLGLGWERYLITFLSRNGLLMTILEYLRNLRNTLFESRPKK